MPAGRPRKEIDHTQFEKLCAMQCTLGEIASYFECSEDTIERMCEREYEAKFAEVFDIYRGKGKIALRRAMYSKGIGGDTKMLIHLGKQYLGHSDKQEISGMQQVVFYDDITELNADTD